MFKALILSNFVLCLYVCQGTSSHHDCAGPRDPGEVCSDEAPSRAFYFDPRMSVCQPFLFNGCGGNTNRFPTSSACRAACSSSQKSGAQLRNANQWTLAEKCGAEFLIPNGKYHVCNAEGLTCPDNHTCNQEAGVCCPSKEFVCSQVDDSGTFVDGVEDRPRFVWSAAIRSCWRFSYYGANGNYNNFPNFKSCVAFCSS